MENLIYCYSAVSYLITIGYAFAMHEYMEWSFNDKEQTVAIILIALFSPLVVPFMIGGLLYKLMKH